MWDCEVKCGAIGEVKEDLCWSDKFEECAFFAGSAGGEGPCDILCALVNVLLPLVMGSCDPPVGY